MTASDYPVHPCANAQTVLAHVCQLLKVDDVTARVLQTPRREVSVTYSYRRDDGLVQVATGCHIQHNDACGPPLGAIYWGTHYSVAWMRALAAWMTWSTALFGLPLGGAAGAIFTPSAELSLSEQERVARGYIRAVGASHRAATTELLLMSGDTRAAGGWMLDELSCLVGASAAEMMVGKPRTLDGMSGHHAAQARTAIIAMQNAARHRDIALRDAPMVIQGFGDLGRHLAQLATEVLDARIVAISDGTVAVHHPVAINWKTAWAHRQQTGSLAGVPETEPISLDAMVELPVTMLCLTTQAAAITADKASRISARMIAEMTCGAVSLDADAVLFTQQCDVLPDVLCMAGEVLLAYFEWVQRRAGLAWDAATIDAALTERISQAYTVIARESIARQITLRHAAYLIAVQRVREACASRGWITG